MADNSSLIMCVLTNPAKPGIMKMGTTTRPEFADQTDHGYPQGYKSYSRGKPLTIDEFDLEKKWGGAQHKGRKTTEQAWKVSAKDIIACNYNLDSKNPHEVTVNHRDPVELMQEFHDITRQLAAVQNALKTELMQALGGWQ